MAAKLILFFQSLKSTLFLFIYTLTDYRIFKKIQNGGLMQDGGNF
jgi:hypothetical protein